MQSLIFILLFPLAFFCTAQEWQQESQLKTDKDQIQLFSQKLPSGLKKVKAITTVRCRLGALILLLHDTARSNQWIDSNQQVEVLDRPASNQAIVHSYFSAPWPFSDRDMVTFSTTTQSPETLQIKIAIRDYGERYSLSKGYVRMTSVEGFWLITPLLGRLNQHKIEIQYQGSADPAGNIPTWLANQIIINSTRHTFKQLRNIIVQAKYQTTPPAYIQEVKAQTTSH